MNINSINNINFNAGAQKDFAPYNPKKNRRHNVDSIIFMDDNEVKKLAYIKTIKNTEDKKHLNASKAMILSAPLAAGAAAALLDPAKVKLAAREVSGPFARVLNGAAGAGRLGALLGTVFLVNKTRQYLEDKSHNFDRFTSENPLITMGASIAAFAGVFALGAKGLSKLSSLALTHIKPRTIVNVDNKIVEFADKFNKNTFVKSTARHARNINNNKDLEPLNYVLKRALSWSPAVLLGAALLNSWNHERVKDIEFVKNYSEMKNIQTRLAQARIGELGQQNKALKQTLISTNV